MQNAAVRVLLENLLPSNAVLLVFSYVEVEVRCTLCDEGKGVPVKDGGGEWQIWCLTCALQLLSDEYPWVSPLHATSCCPEIGGLVSVINRAHAIV
jgi:hypothetical protein